MDLPEIGEVITTEKALELCDEFELGYLLQRRYQADFSARVLYGIAMGLLGLFLTIFLERLA